LREHIRQPTPDYDFVFEAKVIKTKLFPLRSRGGGGVLEQGLLLELGFLKGAAQVVGAHLVLWFIVYGSWLMVEGLWFMVCGPWFMV